VILADTSAWVEFDRATGSRVERRVTELIATGGLLSTTEPVVMEVLAGARDRRARKICGAFSTASRSCRSMLAAIFMRPHAFTGAAGKSG
jgi:predicted nucleic acid-binding protein